MTDKKEFLKLKIASKMFESASPEERRDIFEIIRESSFHDMPDWDERMADAPD